MRGSLRLVLPVLALVPALAAAAPEEGGLSNQDCQECHGKGLHRDDGTSVFVHDARWTASVHGAAALDCTDCHLDLAAAKIMHADDLAPAECAPCHEAAVEQHGRSRHREPRAGGAGIAATCVDCHGPAHEMVAASDRSAPTNHRNLVATCARCHDDPRLVAAFVLPGGIVAAYQDGIHGRVHDRSGLEAAPTCASCHGAHDVDDPESPVSRVKQAATCGACHERIQEEFAQSVHAAKGAGGDDDAPVCADCHRAHAIARTDLPAWQLEVIAECGDCHEESLTTYRDTFHGRVTDLGYARMAKCADCHGAHDIVAKSDPRSPVAGANLVATCRECHPGANARFAQYDPHADPGDKARSAPLYYTALAMKGLLAGVFGFFGLHTLLWGGRGLYDRYRHRRGGT